MTIKNQYLHNNEIDRLSSIQEINRRCIRKIHALRSNSTTTVVVAALPSLMSIQKEG